MDHATKILHDLESARLATERRARSARQRLSAKARAGLRAEALLTALQAGELGPAKARQLAARRGRDRAQVLDAVLKGVAS